MKLKNQFGNRNGFIYLKFKFNIEVYTIQASNSYSFGSVAPDHR